MKSAAKVFILLFGFWVYPSAQAKLQVGATTTDMEALVRAVGGERVEVFSIAKGTQDPHQIEAKPSFMRKMSGVDLVVAQGLDLEAAWLEPLIRGSRSSKIAVGTKGYLELGSELQPLERKTGTVSRAEGDVHPQGNPHFQLDPERMAKAAGLVAKRLSQVDEAGKNVYEENAKKFADEMNKKLADWAARIRKTDIREVITYHKTLDYFLDRFGLTSPLQLEPKPGIPPTASHILEVIKTMKEKKIRLVLIENYFDASVGDKLKSAVPGIRVVRVPVSVGGEPNIKNSFDLIENLVRSVEGK
ncbi:MAG: metal ABC transporter substrate-binding protein [Bdellovibrionales bacterium]